MAEDTSTPASPDESGKPTWILVEAWREDRPVNKLVIADAIKCVVVVVCASVVAYAARLTPGITAERLHLLEAYHFYTVFSLSVFFTLCLFVEVALLLFKRIRKIASTNV